MGRTASTAALGVLVGWVLAGQAAAHFLVLKPSTDIVSADADEVVFDVRFTHPMADGPVMEMGKPVEFGVLLGGRKHDLRDALRPVQIGGKTAYIASYRFAEPGDGVFYIVPAPYWEPAEGKMILHYTKVVVSAFGEQQGWDATAGLPVEIEPLVRPYGLWTGNVFRGVVKRDGRPVPFAEIEVEYLNEGGQVKTPDDAFITQVIKADGQGVFCYAMPRAGWWGFAALVGGEQKMQCPEGKPAEVELGGLIWVRVQDMK